MLPAQVSYWQLQETQRHNLVTEDLGYKNWDLGVQTLEETKRHNAVTESQGWENIALGKASLQENVRHNLVNEGIGYINAESGRVQARASTISAGAAAMNAETNYSEYLSKYDPITGTETRKVGVSEFNAETQRIDVNKKYDLGWANNSVDVTKNEISQQNTDIARERLEFDKKYGWVSFAERAFSDFFRIGVSAVESAAGGGQ